MEVIVAVVEAVVIVVVVEVLVVAVGVVVLVVIVAAGLAQVNKKTQKKRHSGQRVKHSREYK